MTTAAFEPDPLDQPDTENPRMAWPQLGPSGLAAALARVQNELANDPRGLLNLAAYIACLWIGNTDAADGLEQDFPLIRELATLTTVFRIGMVDSECSSAEAAAAAEKAWQATQGGM